MKKIAYCLLLFIASNYVYLTAQSHSLVVSKDKSVFIDPKGKQPSSTAVRVIPRIRENYESTFSRTEINTDRSICGTMPFFEERHESYRSCAFYGEADEPEVRDSYIPSDGTPFKTVRLYVHAFIDGSGDTTATLADVEAQMYTLNEEFSPHRVRFETLYDVHYDSEYDSVSSWGYYLKEAYAVSPNEYHNVYITDLDGYLGVSTFPWDSDALNIYGGTLVDRYWFGGPRYFEGEYDIPQRTLTHELGHALGLWHTHHGVDEVAECGSCYEGADGYSYSGDDNPDVVGDLCSDTKSTPTNFSCSDPSGTDCQGNDWVDTDVHNYMGYASDLCYNQNGEGFSAQQSGRMHAWINEELGSQLVFQDSLPVIPAIFFSEFGEGNSSNRYFEIYNATDDVVFLDDFAMANVTNAPNITGEYEYWNNFDSAATISPGDVYVIAHPNADSLILQEADMYFNYISNGDDGYCIVWGSENNYVIIDCIGDWNGDPGMGWDVAGVSEATRNHTLIRKSSVESGNPNWFYSAGTDADNSEWIVMEENYWDGLGSHPSEPVEQFNYSLSFDGDGDFVSVGDIGDYSPVSYSIMFKPSQNIIGSLNQDQYLISKDGDGEWTFRLVIRSDGKIGLGIGQIENDGSWVLTERDTWYADTWYHVVATINDSLVMSIYVDGVKEGEAVCDQNVQNNPYNTFIGSGVYANGGWFFGHIDDFSIWPNALTGSEVQNLMNPNIPNNEEGSVSYLDFNEGEGNILTDLSGNGNNGIINGAAWSNDVPIPLVFGCTDPYSGNYNPDATSDDGTCSDYPHNDEYALSFDGDDDFVSIPLSPSLNLNQFDTLSIAASFKINSFDHEMGLISFGGTGSGITIAISDGQLMSWFPGYTIGDRTGSLSPDVWYDVIVTYVTGETGSKKIYINGELQVDEFYSYPFYPNQDTSAYLGIGDEFNGYEGRYLDGSVDNVTILNREPYQSEIDIAEFEDDGLMGNWKFGSGSGNVLIDHTGNQNHGTINGASWISAYQDEEGFIIGSVYNEETGHPLSDVYIEAISEDSSDYNWTMTDSSGYFEMGVTGNKNYFFRASSNYSEYVDYFYVTGNETYDLGEIYISDNTTSFVEGWTSDWYTGEPLGGSNVLFVYDHSGETHTLEQSTAADGYFMVQVPADHDYDMFIFADGYWAEHDAFYLSAGDHYTLSIGIAPLNMAARVYGSITDSYSGDIIHGVEAVLNCGDSEDWDHTGALGSYRVFSYYPGDCDSGTLSVRADGYRTQYFPTGEMNLQSGQSLTIDVVLEEGNDPDPSVVFGRVHSSNNGDGIAYAQISIYSYNTSETFGVESDGNGYYYIGDLIGEQDYEIMASADGFMSAMETHYLGSSDSLQLDFYLDQAPESGIYGFVENTNGERLSGVNIYPELDGNEFFWAATDDSGYYHVVLPTGPYFISTGINDYYVSSVSDIEIVDQEMMEINFTLEPIESFDGGAAGIVYSGIGETASGVRINFWNTSLYDAIVHSDENGAYAIDLVNGTYNVSVWGDGFEDVFIPGVVINNNILPLDIYLFDNNSPQPPIIVQLEDIPNDQGGQMDMVWSPGIPMEWEIFPYYSLWRENEDSWHFISMVPYHDFNVYNMVVPTLGDSTHEGIYWSTFMVTAHTEDLYVFFDSESSSGYSVDNLSPDTPVGLSAEIIEGGVLLNWSAPLDEDFAYHNVYRSDIMSMESAMVFNTTDSFFIDLEIDPGSNYDYWVTAVDYSGNESEGSNIVQISPTGLSTIADLIPEVYALGQNYPNPFNPSTQIRYALPEQSQVVLTVYDMLGRKVRTLVNGVQDAGYRTVMWNATSDMGTPVSAGMYIYTIRANEFYQVKKMILLK